MISTVASASFPTGVPSNPLIPGTPLFPFPHNVNDRESNPPLGLALELMHTPGNLDGSWLATLDLEVREYIKAHQGQNPSKEYLMNRAREMIARYI